MDTKTIQIDETTYWRAKQAAATQKTSLKRFIEDIVDKQTSKVLTPAQKDPR